MSWRIVLAACLALLLALTVRWFMPTDRSTTPSTLAPDTRFDYTLTEFDVRFRDAEGGTELEVSGPRLEHIAEERVGIIAEPRFHIEPAGADWQGRARQGRILREDEELILEDDVVLVHNHPDGPIEIHATILRYHRLRRTIRSDEPVEIRKAGSRLDAGAMTIRLTDNIIELSNHVQGEILPHSVERGDSRPEPGNGGG
ncbi:MAG: LPS export ABC transporter periplasmic protein LptC [Wenzhouxiangella sp.]